MEARLDAEFGRDSDQESKYYTTIEQHDLL